MHGAGFRLLLPLLLLVAPAPVQGDEPAWHGRIGAELEKIEAGVAALDQQPAALGTLIDRVTSLHERLAVLEAARGITPVPVEAKDELAALTIDVVSLKRRLEVLVSPPKPPEVVPAKPPQPTGPPPGPSPGQPGGPPPPKPSGPQWPPQLRFPVNAKLTYVETGHWVVDQFQGPFATSFFLHDGYEGQLTFSVRARGLVRQIQSVHLLVAVSLGPPFTDQPHLWRTYNVTWTAQRSLWNEAVRSWPNHDRIVVSVPPRSIRSPKKITANLHAEAHVVSITLKDGTVVPFQMPEGQPR